MYNSLKKTKYLGINLTKDVNDLYNENYKPLKKKNQRGLQKMESSPMFMDWQNQCCENGYITRKKTTCSMQSPSKFQ
jgi:hypothetical protein